MAQLLDDPERVSAQLVFECVLPMRWGDLDAMGHMNNTLYFRFMEEARIRWFTACGFSPNPQGQGPVIINASCSFLRQFEYPSDIIVRHFLGAVGRSSFQTYIDMLPTHSLDGQPWAQGAAKGVWIDSLAKKSLPIPAAALEAIRQMRVAVQ